MNAAENFSTRAHTLVREFSDIGHNVANPWPVRKLALDTLAKVEKLIAMVAQIAAGIQHAPARAFAQQQQVMIPFIDKQFRGLEALLFGMKANGARDTTGLWWPPSAWGLTADQYAAKVTTLADAAAYQATVDPSYLQQAANAATSAMSTMETVAVVAAVVAGWMIIRPAHRKAA